MQNIIISLMLLFIGNVMPDKPTQQQTKTVKNDFDIVLDMVAKWPGRKSYHYKKAYIGIIPNGGYIISRYVKGKPGYNAEFMLVTNMVRSGLTVELINGAGVDNVRILKGRKAMKFLNDRKFSLKRADKLFIKHYFKKKKKKKKSKRREGSF